MLLIQEALREMQDAFETCTREYELYPEPTVKNIIMALYNDSFSGMTTVLETLQERPKMWAQDRHLQVL